MSTMPIMSDQEASRLISSKDIFTSEDNKKAAQYYEKRYELRNTGDVDRMGDDITYIEEVFEYHDAESLMNMYAGITLCKHCVTANCDRIKLANEFKELWTQRYPQALDRKKVEYPKHLQQMYREFFAQLCKTVMTTIKTAKDFESNTDYVLKLRNYNNLVARIQKLIKTFNTKKQDAEFQLNNLKMAVKHVETVFSKHSELRKNMQVQRVHLAVDLKVKELKQLINTCSQQLKQLRSMDMSAYDPKGLLNNWVKSLEADASKIGNIYGFNYGYISEQDYTKWSNYTIPEFPVIPEVPSQIIQAPDGIQVLKAEVPEYYYMYEEICNEANIKASRLTVSGWIKHNVFMMPHKTLQYM